MTAVVGILCSNGVVVGTDSSATFAHTSSFATIEQTTEHKLVVLEERVLVAGTGPVGFGQRFRLLLNQLLQQNLLDGKPMEAAKQVSAAMIRDLVQTGCSPGDFGALVAFPSADDFHLCEFGVPDFQPEFKEDLWYCSMGSTQPITDPFLALMRDIFWESGPPNVQDGMFAATWALEHAIQVNPGGVNGPARIGVLQRDESGELRARGLKTEELDEHRQNIEAAKDALRQFKIDQAPRAESPELPKPPPVIAPEE